MLAVRWYLRYGPSYRDVRISLPNAASPWIMIYRWVQRFTPS
jgi:transposase-like protein